MFLGHISVLSFLGVLLVHLCNFRGEGGHANHSNTRGVNIELCIIMFFYGNFPRNLRGSSCIKFILRGQRSESNL